MNREGAPDYVELSAPVSVQKTEDLMKYIRALSKSTIPTQEPLVQPIITPRFAITCTDELLESLGQLAAAHPTVPIQTHIAENRSEIEFTLRLFPFAPHYAGVYDHFKLLRKNTILAHAVHMSNAELDLVKARQSGISHCPTSNFNLNSGVAPIGEYLDKGLKVRQFTRHKSKRTALIFILRSASAQTFLVDSAYPYSTRSRTRVSPPKSALSNIMAMQLPPPRRRLPTSR